MLKKLFLPLFLLVLSIGFWYSQNFELVAVGIAILLLGIHTLESGFRSAAEGRLKVVLQKMGGGFGKGFTLGFTSTAVFQSSTLVTVVAISFISAGLLSLQSGLGIVFGANLGTTATSWLVALFGLKLKLSHLAAPLIVFGVLFSFQKKKGNLVSTGQILLGLGFFFTGIYIMQQGFEDYQRTISLDTITVSGTLRNVIFLALGIAFTMILQSSSATMAIVLTAMFSNQINYPDGISLAIGANVGTTFTAIIGASVSNTAGKQVALGHFIFNMVTAIVAVLLLHPLLYMVDVLSAFIGIRATDFTLKLSLFHSMFNLLGIFLMLPFLKIMSKFLTKMIPEKQERVVQPKYLNKAVLEFSQTAKIAVLEESRALFKDVKKLLLKAIDIPDSSMHSLKDIETAINKKIAIKKINLENLYEINIKPIYSKIIKYASKIDDWNYFDEIRTVNRQMIALIKEMELLHENICTMSDSNNDLLRYKYNEMRFLITSLIYESEKIDSVNNLPEYEKLIKMLRNESKRHEHEIVVQIPEWIKDRKLSSKEATSMLNDSHYTSGICKNIQRVIDGLYRKHSFKDEDEEVVVEDIKEIVMDD